MDSPELPFQRRQLIRVEQPGDDQEYEFSVVTYNILADYWIRRFAGDVEMSSFCPCDFTFYESEGKHSPRHKLLMAEVQWLDSDILCLQEVDTAYFTKTLKDSLSSLGYESLFAEKFIPEGVALAYRRDKFQLEQTKTLYFKDLAELTFKQQGVLEVNEVLLVAALRHKISKHVPLIGVTHILWGDFLKPVTQVCEIALATQALGDMVSSIEAKGEHVAYILCGDFNIEPQFPAYGFLKEGKLNDKHEKNLKQLDHIRFAADTQKPKEIVSDQVSLLSRTKDHFVIPLRNLLSAYKNVMGVEPQYTNREEGGNVWTLDYIWFDANTLNVTAVLDIIPESVMTTYVGLPNQYFPSDHLSLKAVFKFS